ncbi:MAG: RES family NAD+ phosphorylase [Elstera sp.]
MPFSQTLPKPPEQTAVTHYCWSAGRVFHRIHAAQYGAAEFNESPHGSARFSPLRPQGGAIIPTLYGGETFECAAMETVFHDVPFAPGLKTIAKRRLEARCASRITAQTDLTLIDLSAVALRKLGLMRKQLIDTEADCYPQTRHWALALYHQRPECQGLCWISR